MRNHERSTPRSGRGQTQRQLRIGEVLRHALVEALARGDVRDPGLAGLSVTVTEVRTSPDLRNATVFVMPLGGVGTQEALAALRRAAPYLRRLIGEKVTMRHLPAFSFQLDTAFERGEQIERLFRSDEVRRDLRGPDDGTGDGA